MSYRSPGVVIALLPLTKGRESAGSDSISIGLGGVDDLKTAMAGLNERGVPFSRVAADRPTRLAFFTDQDGNPLHISETKGLGRVFDAAHPRA